MKKINKKLLDTVQYGNDYTIDLRAMQAQEYLDDVYHSRTIDRIADAIIKTLVTAGIAFFIILILLMFTGEAKANYSVQEQVRLERLQICQNAYQTSTYNKRYIYEQLPAVRCATFMSLVYAFESDYGKSNMCRTMNNCWGIKGNGVDTPRGFLTFKNETEGREYFARKYFQWHYKKKINDFVNSRSMTDQTIYKNFMKQKYFNLYRELEYMYMTY